MMGIRDWSTRTVRLLWEVDLGALLILSAPYIMGGAYGRTVGNAGTTVAFGTLFRGWLLCSIPVFLITWIWFRGRRAARLAKQSAQS